MTSKNSDEVTQAFQKKKIYKRSLQKWPQMLPVDPGREFMGAVTKEMENHKTYIRGGRVDIHGDQAIVERFNRTLAERLFGYQYAIEVRPHEGQWYLPVMSQWSFNTSLKFFLSRGVLQNPHFPCKSAFDL